MRRRLLTIQEVKVARILLMADSTYRHFIGRSEGGIALRWEKAETGCKHLVISYTAAVAAGAAVIGKTLHALLHR